MYENNEKYGKIKNSIENIEKYIKYRKYIQKSTKYLQESFCSRDFLLVAYLNFLLFYLERSEIRGNILVPHLFSSYIVHSVHVYSKVTFDFYFIHYYFNLLILDFRIIW